MASVVFSVSSWQQPVPEPISAERSALLERLAGRVVGLGSGRLRVGIDGGSAAGKTSLGHELASWIARAGRPVLRACLDDFKRPWRDRLVVDRESAEGYYRNAFDWSGARRLLLDPFGSGGAGAVALCSIDPLTQVDHSAELTAVPEGAVLVVDGVFAFRPQLVSCWDLRVWVGVDPDVAVSRSVVRDESWAGSQARELMLTRYLPGERLYRQEVDPVGLAHVALDNSDVARPHVIKWSPGPEASGRD